MTAEEIAKLRELCANTGSYQYRAGRALIELPRALDEIERLRGLLARVVKYATEDRARTPGVTRFARVVDEARVTLGLAPDAEVKR